MKEALLDIAAAPISVIILSDHGHINGGQAKVAIESALHLKRRGLDVCFVAGAGPLDERLPKSGIECHLVGTHDILSDPNRLRGGARGIWNRQAARVLASALASRDARSTVVHTHGWAKALSPSIGPVIARSGAAHVYTLHEYFLACPNGGFYHHGAAQICTRRPLGFDCLTTNCDARSRSHKAWRVARQAVLWTAGGLPSGLRDIIYLAPEQREIMAPHISPEARWHYLPNAVGPRPLARVAAERNAHFLFIGRLSPEKGAEIAARAARLAGVPIGFCGDGECEEAVRQANPDAQMLGWLDPEELSEWMRKARCLVFPSLWYECYPLVVADALRVGLPVIVSKSSVATSSIADGIEGLHCAGGDVGAWTEAMMRLKSDVLVQSMSEQAFEAGGRLRGYDDYTSSLIEIYQAALAREHEPEAASLTAAVPA
jgi:glycosyltransferase involved in cell wall biosynthesis